MTKIRIALIAALLAGTASAAVARTAPQHTQDQSGYGQVYTDEGQGRQLQVDGDGG